jgi:cobalt-zinc-cadmium efflux system membrane fusion protein
MNSIATRRSRLHVAALMFALLPLAATVGCKEKPKEAAAKQASDPNEVSVTPGLAANLKFGTPQMMDVTGTLQVAAHVETDARNIARVGSPVAGRILRLLAFEGGSVRAGTVLATLHSTSLSDTQFALI